MKKVIAFAVLNFLSIVLFAGNLTVDKQVNSLPYETLSASEVEGIMQMREEEKLARDVYLELYKTWDLPVFYNIAQSEQTHMDAVKTLIEKYNLKDPITDEDFENIGVFKNEELQNLFNELLSLGEKSLSDALKVGATIEDLDIFDLEELLKSTDNEDIKFIYNNLMKGSENHMRSFIKNLDKLGKTYTPQFISLERFREILKF
ncbi:hypothetical protein H17ap60334_07163 [Thermosipho africanus H17ap60334]|jgi:hypothetical protein|uniref:DUF2202 domain-containing protein n=1 Tax=Thermosipho africanus (strain TCF52B) TaxID=484019 RepID=B7IED8_THEAB|nr:MULTISPECIES: DUF2202 domain-containing protein [Thermosipho]ACJ76365.1 conserved hypothetical protein [Thermosipho africanus TCF52B]EKF49153.1 hypothetical protein H17ap60334_07163 [Thermosipho africanus H17ap60334]MBZ4649607.1 hypothetical protein [Thermosipho sp. (in: thermotogales)]MDK2839973.1 hypothetical protein [Thermosipho sp. (in: thermotogales)]MDK2900989.1 hypothetical protein [Thermosipho sp. (in: thermotogales)]